MRVSVVNHPDGYCTVFIQYNAKQRPDLPEIAAAYFKGFSESSGFPVILESESKTLLKYKGASAPLVQRAAKGFGQIFGLEITIFREGEKKTDPSGLPYFS